MRVVILSLTVAGLAAVAAGCFVQDTIFGDSDRDFVRARVTFGFEEAAIRPCNTDEQWWVVGDQELQERWYDLDLEWYEHGYAEVRGERSEKGQYGHLGAYDREFSVAEVVEVRLLKDGECPWPKTAR